MLEFEREQAEAVRKMPTFTEWCGYNLFPPSSWVGESVPYADWISFIRYQGKVTQMRVGSNFSPALRRLIEAELFLAVGVNVLKVASPIQLTDPTFADNSYLYQIIFVGLACQASIFRLGSRFVSLDSACIASGISYMPATDEKSEEFNSIRHGEILKANTASDAAVATKAWNMRTQYFL